MICKGLTRPQSNSLYLEVLSSNDEQALRRLCREDLFFLLTIACKRKDIDKDWLYERCREVETEPNGYLDLWAREHYKSTILTYGKSIQDILASHGDDPLPVWNGLEVTIGIFSHTRPIAKAFLDQIKTEFELNTFLQDLFPDILYKKPKSESSKWSLDEGIKVKRKDNNKEPTVSAWGLVDGQPTSKHFHLLVYDDVVTLESVTTPEQIQKTTSALEMSYNLGARGGFRRFIGTRYHANDTYRTIMSRGTVIPRIKPATDNGTLEGNPVFLDRKTLDEKRRDMGPYTFGAQMLQDPVADKSMGFKSEWLKFYKKLGDISKWNKYILIDPASKKKTGSDYTVILVVALAPDNNYYLIDGVRDRLNLTQRAAKVFEFHMQYDPLDVGYEEYGMQADIEHIQYEMEHRNYRFKITPLGGSMAKVDRIKRLVPIYEQHRFYLPEKLTFVDYEGRTVDLIRSYIDDEYSSFPVCVHDDMMDCKARILDPVLDAKFPKAKKPPSESPRQYSQGSQGLNWMG